MLKMTTAMNFLGDSLLKRWRQQEFIFSGSILFPGDSIGRECCSAITGCRVLDSWASSGVCVLCVCVVCVVCVCVWERERERERERILPSFFPTTIGAWIRVNLIKHFRLTDFSYFSSFPDGCFHTCMPVHHKLANCSQACPLLTPYSDRKVNYSMLSSASSVI